MTTNDQPMDHVPPESAPDNSAGGSDMEKNVTSRSTWLRLFFMIVVALLYGISRVVIAAVIVIQFFYVLVTGQSNEQLKQLGHSLAIYSYQVINFLTFNTERKPFPFDASWPTSITDD